MQVCVLALWVYVCARARKSKFMQIFLCVHSWEICVWVRERGACVYVYVSVCLWVSFCDKESVCVSARAIWNVRANMYIWHCAHIYSLQRLSSIRTLKRFCDQVKDFEKKISKLHYQTSFIALVIKLSIYLRCCCFHCTYNRFSFSVRTDKSRPKTSRKEKDFWLCHRLTRWCITWRPRM